MNSLALESVNISPRTYINDKNSLYIIEQIFGEESSIKDVSSERSGPKITILSKPSNPVSTISIMMLDEDELLGYVCASLYTDKTASMTTTGISGLELPDYLQEYQKQIVNTGVGLYISEKARGTGKSKELIYLILKALNYRGINTLNICSISNDIAWNAYKGTNATPVDDRNAVYYDIENLLKDKRFEEQAKNIKF